MLLFKCPWRNERNIFICVGCVLCFYYTTCVLKANHSSMVLKIFSGKAVFLNKLIKTLRI